MHFRGVIWKIKPKSNFPVSFNLISAEMNLVANYRTLRGLRTVNPEGLPSTKFSRDALCGIEGCWTRVPIIGTIPKSGISIANFE